MINNNILIILPLILGIVTSIFCRPNGPNGRNGQHYSNVIKIPNYIFIIIWPILYILLGVSWYLTSNNLFSNIMFGLLNLCLCLWLIIYSCYNNKSLAFYILLLSLLLTLMCFVSCNNNMSKYLISPLFVWLIVALIISYN